MNRKNFLRGIAGLMGAAALPKIAKAQAIDAVKEPVNDAVSKGGSHRIHSIASVNGVLTHLQIIGYSPAKVLDVVRFNDGAIAVVVGASTEWEEGQWVQIKAALSTTTLNPRTGEYINLYPAKTETSDRWYSSDPKHIEAAKKLIRDKNAAFVMGEVNHRSKPDHPAAP